MDFLSQIGKQALGKLFGGDSAQKLLSPELLTMAESLLQKAGGVNGIMDKLKAYGLDQKIQDWISGTQTDQPISGQDMKQAFGSDLDDVAAENGQEVDVAANGLADILPRLLAQFKGGANGTIGGNDLQEAMKKFFS